MRFLAVGQAKQSVRFVASGDADMQIDDLLLFELFK